MFYSFEKGSQKNPWSMTNMNYHNNFELYFLLDGERYFTIENEAYKISPLTFVYVPPFVMHKTEGDAFSKINIYYSADYFNETENSVFTKLLGRKAIIVSEENKAKVLELLNKLEQWSKVDSPEATVYTKALLLELLCLMCDEESATPVGVPKETNLPAVLQKILKYIDDNLQNDLSLSKICDEFFISYVYLCKLFKKYMPTSVNRTIENARVEKARKLLKDTHKSVEKISEECGFSSSNYFSLVFKRNTGLSPLNYRKYLKER